MEFHETARVIEIGALQAPSKFMEFHGTAHVSEIGVLQFPLNLFFYNLMKPIISSKLLVLNFDSIPWNFEFPSFDDNYIEFCRMNFCP